MWWHRHDPTAADHDLGTRYPGSPVMFDPSLKAIEPDVGLLRSVEAQTGFAPAPSVCAPAPVFAAALIAFGLDALLSFSLPIGVGTALRHGPIPDSVLNAAVLTASLVALLGLALGSYREALQPRRQTRAAFSATVLALVVTGLSLYLFQIADASERRLMLLATLPLPPAIAGARWALASLLARDPRRRFAARTLLIGAGDHGTRLVQALQTANDRTLRLIGYADDHATRIPNSIGNIAHLGSIEQAFGLIGRGEVDQVIVALPWSAEQRTLDLLRRLATFPVHVRLAPELILYHFAGTQSTEVAGLPLLHLLDRPISGAASLLKRGEDVLLGGLCLIALAVPMLLIAFAVRLESSGPALFRQRRTGFNNREFEMLKFRTMLPSDPCETALRQTTRDDPRVTRVGAILRRASLDELPQLINVLRGEMSLVGPRPHAPGTRAGDRPFEQVISSYAARHRVRPGLTGLAQVRGWRGETETESKLVKRVESDLEYIEQWSLWLDLVILFRTAAAVLSMRNAY